VGGDRRLAFAVVIGLLAACGPNAGSAAPSVAPSASVATPAGSQAAVLPVLGEGDLRPLPAGTFVTGPNGFLTGLTITIPDGWESTETDSGEISLAPAGQPDRKLLIWKDLVAVAPGKLNGPAGATLPNVGRTADALITWLTTTPDFKVLSGPTDRTVGGSIAGKELTVVTSDTANFGDPGCPDNPRCAAFFTDPDHWNGDFYAIGGDEQARIFIATMHFPDADHVLFVTLECLNADELAKFAPIAEPIIASLRLPATFLGN